MPIPSTEKIAFAPIWIKGDRWTYSYQLESTFKTTFSWAKGFRGNSRATILMDCEVTKVGRTGNATFECTYRHGELEEFITDGRRTGVPYAGKDGRSPLQKMYSQLPGLSFAASLDATGRVTKVSGTSMNVAVLAITEPVQSDISRKRKLTRKELDEFAMIFAKSFDAENMRRILEYLFWFYPGKRVKTGDRWAIQSRTDLKKSSRPVTSTFTLYNATRNRENLKFDINATATEGRYGDVNDESGSGTIVVDRKSGLPIRVTRRSRTTMTQTWQDGTTTQNATHRRYTLEIRR